MEINSLQFISMLREIAVASNREIRKILIRTISVHGEFDSDDFLMRRLAKFAIQFLTDENSAAHWQQAYNDYVVYAAQEREVLKKKLEQTETALKKAEADIAEYRKIVANQSTELTKATEQFAQLIK